MFVFGAAGTRAAPPEVRVSRVIPGARVSTGMTHVSTEIARVFTASLYQYITNTILVWCSVTPTKKGAS